jgi:hypothetical protein
MPGEPRLLDLGFTHASKLFSFLLHTLNNARVHIGTRGPTDIVSLSSFLFTLYANAQKPQAPSSLSTANTRPDITTRID